MAEQAATTTECSALGRLSEIEAEIRHLLGIAPSGRLRLCQCLSHLEREKLYRAVGASNFKEYLRTKRVPIPYQTAQQYSSIGEVADEQTELLESVGFRETDGLCKLRLLKAALDRHDDHEEVAQHLKVDSFRSFRDFARGDRKPIRAEISTSPASYSPCWTRVHFDDDTIRVTTCEGRDEDLVWLNPEVFSDADQYREFVRMAIALVRQTGGADWPFIRSYQARVS